MIVYIYELVQTYIYIQAYKWQSSPQSVSPAEPDIDSEEISQDMQNPIRALYSPRNAEVGIS